MLSFICVVSAVGGEKRGAESLEEMANESAENGSHRSAIRRYSKAAKAYYKEGNFVKFSSMKEKEAEFLAEIVATSRYGNDWDANDYLDKYSAALAASTCHVNKSSFWILLNYYATEAKFCCATRQFVRFSSMKRSEAEYHGEIEKLFAESRNDWYANYHRTKASEALAAAKKPRKACKKM